MTKHPTYNEKKELKSKYKNMYSQLELIVNNWDPIGLIAGGAPSDEYDCISVQLISMLIQDKNSKEIFDFIIFELDKHFGMGLDSITKEKKEQFMQNQFEFSESLIEWYKNIKKNNN